MPAPVLSRVVSSDGDGVAAAVGADVDSASETGCVGSPSAGRIAYWTDRALASAVGTVVAFTERGGGVSAAPYDSLDLATHVGDSLESVSRNRDLLLSSLGLSDMRGRIVCPRQVHGTVVETIDGGSWKAFQPRSEGSDAIVCAAWDVPVLLCFADCVPVILVAPDGSFAVVHAGWRGALADIPAIAARALSRAIAPDGALGCCNAYIGPHIGACCFETGSDVASAFRARFGDAVIVGGDHVDLSYAVRLSLLSAGFTAERIVDAHVCTCCEHERFFSYRAEGGTTGRIGALACRRRQGHGIG